jgi:hypothetical protein
MENSSLQTTPRQKLRDFVRWAIEAFIWISVSLFFVWAIGAIYHLYYLPRAIRLVAAIVYVGLTALFLFRSANKRRVRTCFIVSIALVYLLTLAIRPSNDRQWDPDQVQVADVAIESGNVTIKNFRHCQYRSASDYDANFETKTFALNDIISVDLIVQRFTAKDGLAHVFLSFGLKPNGREVSQQHFSVSVEIRREIGETYGPIKGIYRTYELTHVIGDERDLIGVRTIQRPDDRVYLYPINATPGQAQQLFVNFADRIASLRMNPRFYHSLLNNCANGVTQLTCELTPEPINWLDPRIVLPGYSAAFAFEKGLIGDPNSEVSFQELEKNSRIDMLARDSGITESFSKNIRQGSERHDDSH